MTCLLRSVCTQRGLLSSPMWRRFSPIKRYAPNFTRPEELRIDLLRPYQVFQLFQAGERPVFKVFFRHLNALKQIIELFRAASRVPGASEPGQMLANLLKGHTIAPIILAGSSKT